MRAGRLRHKVSIQSATEARDAHGGVTRSWSESASVWASIEPLSGRELSEARQIAAETTHRIRLRYLSSLAPDQRIVHDSRTFEIVSIANVEERNREMVVLAKERVE